jgi:hypothetical protein
VAPLATVLWDVLPVDFAVLPADSAALLARVLGHSVGHVELLLAKPTRDSGITLDMLAQF